MEGTEKPLVNSEVNPMFDLDDDLRWILGRPGFSVREIAFLLKRGGHYKVVPKVEDEQAVAIHWMVCLYLKHGNNWRAEGDRELKEIQSRLNAETTQKGI